LSCLANPYHNKQIHENILVQNSTCVEKLYYWLCTWWGKVAHFNKSSCNIRKASLDAYQGTGTLIEKYNANNRVLLFPRAYCILALDTEEEAGASYY
jgi:hypothetical protein